MLKWIIGLVVLVGVSALLLVEGLGGIRFSVPVGENGTIGFRMNSVSLNRIGLKEVVVETTWGNAEVGAVDTEINWEVLTRPRLGQVLIRDWSVEIPLKIPVDSKGGNEGVDGAKEEGGTVDKGMMLELPFKELLMEAGRLDLVGEDGTRLGFLGEAQVREEVSSILGTLHLENEQLDVETTFKMFPDEGDWSAQVALKTRALVEQYLFLEKNLEFPALPNGLKINEVGTVQLEGLMTGKGGGIEEQSWLLEGGKIDVDWEDSAQLVIGSWAGGATLAGKTISKFNVGANVEKLGWEDWTAEGFQVSGSQNAETQWTLELPQLNWKKGDELAGGLAGRIFVKKQGETIEGIEAEGQIAISRLEGFDHELSPFRIFGGLNEGIAEVKLSPVSLKEWPDWRLVDGFGEWNQKTEEGTLKGQLEYYPESRPILEVNIAVEDRGEEGLHIRGEIDGEIEERLADIEMTQRGDGGWEGRASGSWDMTDTWFYMELFYEEALKIESGGRLDWKAAIVAEDAVQARIDFEVFLKDVLLKHLEIDQWSVDQINAEIKGHWGEGLNTEGLQRVQIGELRFGAHVLKEVTIEFRIEGTERLTVESLEGEWMGGRLSLSRFVVNPFAPDFTTEIHFEGIDAELLMAQFSDFKMKIVGQMDGSIPFRYRNGKVMPERGHLKARTTPQAILFFEDEEQIAQYLRLPDAFQMKSKAMKAIMGGINIHEFVIDLFNPVTPLQPILMDIKGSLETKDVQLQGLNIRVPVRVDSTDYMDDLQFLLGLFTGG